VIIELNRLVETDESIIGEFITDGFKSFSLEPSRNHPVHVGHPCVAAGTYAVTGSHSEHLGYYTPELQNVPNRTNIRIHIGNYPKDSLGCILLGKLYSATLPNVVRTSEKAFDSFMQLFNAAIARKEEIKIIISDCPLGVTSEK
jgi:hypothetical protein